MIGADALLAQLQSQRRKWVDIEDGVKIQIDTPTIYRAMKIGAAIKAGDGERVISEVSPLVTAWEGVTGVTLLGAAVGSSDPVPADPRLFAVIAGDRPEWVNALAVAALDAASTARAAIEASTKN